MPRRPVSHVRRRRRTKVRSFFVVLAFTTLISAVLIALFYGTRMETFRVTTVTVQGGTTISPAAVRSVAEEVLDGSYMGLIPHRFSYAVPYEEIERRVRDMPRLARVRITHPDRATVALVFEEYHPTALWCDGVARCMFIDDAGYAFAEAPENMKGSLYPRLVVASSSPRYAAHISADIQLDALATLRDTFVRLGLSLVQAEYVDTYDVWYVFSGGGIIKTRRADAPEDIGSRLEQVLATPEYATLATAGFKSIDIRFGNRVYVRDKNAPDAEATTTSATGGVGTSTQSTVHIQ